MGGQPALLTILNIHKTGTNRAQPGQARYPTGASTVPNMGKHRAQNKDKYCLFINTK